jgi:hemolysin activation/secretion protein
MEAGISGFGARLDNFADPDDPHRADFTIARLQYIDLLSFNDAWTLRTDTYVQHSPNLLPSIKRFTVGGGRIGRGFDAAALSGDRGLGSKIELRRRLASGVPLVDRVDAYGFYDLGGAWAHDVPGRESAASAGVGLSLRAERLTGYLEVAKPLTHADADGRKDGSIFVELTARF